MFQREISARAERGLESGLELELELPAADDACGETRKNIRESGNAVKIRCVGAGYQKIRHNPCVLIEVEYKVDCKGQTGSQKKKEAKTEVA